LLFPLAQRQFHAHREAALRTIPGRKRPFQNCNAFGHTLHAVPARFRKAVGSGAAFGHAAAVVFHRKDGGVVGVRKPHLQLVGVGVAHRVGNRLARDTEQGHVDVGGHLGGVVAGVVVGDLEPGLACVLAQVGHAVGAVGGLGFGFGVFVAQDADHRADLFQGRFRREANLRHRFLGHGRVAVDEALGRGSLDAHRRKRMGRDVVDFAGDAHALLFDAAGRFLFDAALGFLGARLRFFLVVVEGVEGQAHAGGYREQGEVLHDHR